jgi:hypothetical protein
MKERAMEGQNHIRSDGPIPAAWERPRLDRSIHMYIDDTKTVKGAFESTKRSILSKLVRFDTRPIQALLSFKSGVEKGRHYRARQT